ncbi:hypothetical protein RMATCC62417_05845 [Rhizopus microsporus]|nr:hypothetical protein RMATCC62417_05845 [Rhizopus microsporus]
MEDDLFSTTNVSLLDDIVPFRPLTSSPVSLKHVHNSSSSTTSSSNHYNHGSSSSSSEQWNVVDTPLEGSTEFIRDKSIKPTQFSMPLKHQENTVDILKKENFDLRLKIYYLENRLLDLSPSNVEAALKENVDLKVTVQKLTQELKKYKKLILELEAAIEIVNKPCPKQHGMSQAEKDELTAAIMEAKVCREENDKLSQMRADVLAENKRLRDELRFIREQKVESSQPRTHKEDYPTNTKRLEEKLRSQSLEIASLKDEVEKRQRQMDDLRNQLKQSTKDLNETRQQLKSKILEYERSMKHEDDNKLMDTIRQLRKENDLLINEIQEREQDVADLEEEMQKLVTVLDEKNKEEGDNDLEEKIMTLEATIQERDEDIEVLKDHITKTQRELEEKNEANKELLIELQEAIEKSEQIRTDYENQVNQINELEIGIKEKDERMAALEEDYKSQLYTTEREKKLVEDDVKELKHKLRLALKQLKEKEKEAEHVEKWKERVYSLEDQLKNFRGVVYKLKKAQDNNMMIKNTLEQPYKNKTSNNTLEQVLKKLNDELRKELDDKTREYEREKMRATELQDLYNQQLEIIRELEEKLSKKSTMLALSLSEYDELQANKKIMDSILVKQVTGTQTFHERIESVTMNH